MSGCVEAAGAKNGRVEGPSSDCCGVRTAFRNESVDRTILPRPSIYHHGPATSHRMDGVIVLDWRQYMAYIPCHERHLRSQAAGHGEPRIRNVPEVSSPLTIAASCGDACDF